MKETKKIWREADAVMFDVDSTVVREEGIDRLADFCGKGAEISKMTRDAMNKGLEFRESLRRRLELIDPTLEQLEDFIRLHPTTLTPGIEELIRLLHGRDVQVYLVSGGFDRIIEPTRFKLNIPEENLFANRLLFDENGLYAGFDTTRLTSKNSGKAEVAGLLKRKFRYKNLVMVGDGSIDADACPPADAFIGFGGNAIRENVKAKAKWYVTSFKELINESTDQLID
ncbi:hypothetical protein RUM43_006417 [Polyplax serrata]|uniref:Phosphoserine phosphatase n=1 Tax=Polyplax serrata TaxID=468196 RepID=A0AAN8S5F4_POLSC